MYAIFTLFLAPFVIFLSLSLGGIYCFLIPFSLFIMSILIDKIWQRPPRTSQRKTFPSYRIALLSYVPISFALFIWIAYTAESVRDQPLYFLSLMYLAAVLTSYSFAISHELLHANRQPEKWLAKSIYLLYFWGYFYLDHLKNHHHKHIEGTAEDAGTPKLGESIYYFLWNYNKDAAISAWEVEKMRAEKAHSAFPFFYNQFVWVIGIPSLVLFLLSYFIGPFASLIYVFQSIAGIAIYCTFAYVQHYGLIRKKQPNHTYENFMPWHTWNSYAPVVNAFVLNQAKHASHHIKPHLAHYHLEFVARSAILPVTYQEAMLLTLIPPAWFKVMDKRAKEILRQGDNLNC